MKKGAVNGGRFLTLCQTVTDFSGSLSFSLFLFTCLEFSLKNAARRNILKGGPSSKRTLETRERDWTTKSSV